MACLEVDKVRRRGGKCPYLLFKSNGRDIWNNTVLSLHIHFILL